MKIKLLPIFFSIAFSVVSCSSDKDCFVADNVTQVKIINIKGDDYFLYLRISGFHEKEVFYELYQQEPTFDLCGKSNVQTLSEAHIDSTEGAVASLVVEDLKLRVMYTKENGNGKADYKTVPIKIK